MSGLVAAIDGGQSSTRAIIGDERGRILGSGAAGPCDEIGQNAGSTRLADAIESAVRAACNAAGFKAGTRFEAIVAAISGYEGRIYGARPALPSDRVLFVHDARAAHAGAMAGLPGVIVVAGTGSVVYGRNERGDEATFGGWGYLFGDEGSAFWIAREALTALLRAQDAGSTEAGDQERAALDFFGVSSLREIARGFYAGDISRERVAAFVPAALRFPENRAIVKTGAEHLAALACRALHRLDVDSLALSGGLFENETVRTAFAGALLGRCSRARIVPAKYSPVEGALLLAYRQAGRAIAALWR